MTKTKTTAAESTLKKIRHLIRDGVHPNAIASLMNRNSRIKPNYSDRDVVLLATFFSDAKGNDLVKNQQFIALSKSPAKK